ncbi:MAG TPA: hypothetical protein VMY05_09495 [Acidobacteriota bacterium]|nr:hypothetical protein [Acidobacteriota bacterium]
MTEWSIEYTFDVDTGDRIIYEKIYGLWKQETAERYHRDFMKAVQLLLGKPWAKLVDLVNWRTSYPQVTDRIADHLRWCQANNMVLSVNVLNNISTYRQLNRMFTGGGTGPISKTFSTRTEAEEFLKEHWFKRKK